MSQHIKHGKFFVDVIGLEAATALFDALGGTNFPFPLGINNNPEGAARFKQLEEIVGASAALELIKVCGGDYVYIPNCRYARTRARNREIVRAYDSGATLRDLALQYRLSERQISTILKRTPPQEAASRT